MQHVLITGANRGIGLAFVEAYLARGAVVFAGCRQPSAAPELAALHATYGDHLHIVALDVSVSESVAALAAYVHAQTPKLDRLINNAAVFSTVPFGELTYASSQSVFLVNSIGAVMVAQALFDKLEAAPRAVIANISSNRGSVSGQRDGNLMDYAASKAALNSYTRSLAALAQARGMLAVMIDPGWVQTRMGGDDADLTPSQTVAGMVQLIEQLTPQQNGGFYNWDGTTHAW